MKKMLHVFQYNAPVTLTFSLISLCALWLSHFLGQEVMLNYFSLYRTSWTDPMQYLRLFTYVLGHANYSHFINNITVILLIGPMLEEKYGNKTMVGLIIFTALVTGLIHVFFFPDTALLGASGIAFMMILLCSFANAQKGRLPITFLLVAVIFLGGEINTGLTTTDNISQLGHIIGGVCGGLAGLVITARRA